ncbi:SAF domain-containing protein [Schaalia sp. lx-260]|uniref:SAF domain-containing protein n=1 Tax=Schaalia sp. lx-260 TaxID=2899082 RepID=UPI001E330F7C|nr:SAF domain-containing protein [Schaalia sp. lx-260]MCD4549010.1 SAF domain-containing protein [Schaalia sp. lx-260]
MRFLHTWPLVRRFLYGLTIVTALAAALYVFWPTQERHVLIAARPLITGTRIEEGALKTVPVPSRYVPEDFLSPNAVLPEMWDGISLKAGTILTESLLAASPAGRAIPPGFADIPLLIDAAHTPELENGDLVDIWALPSSCDSSECAATRIAQNIYVVSSAAKEGTSWASSAQRKIILRLPGSDTEKVLGYAGGGILSVVLHSRGGPPPL